MMISAVAASTPRARNVSIVESKGTEESKEMLKCILKNGVASLEDRVHVALMGPPIPPYKIRCYCGHTINVGRDEGGYYIEGADLIIFEPGDKPPTKEREGEKGPP